MARHLSISALIFESLSHPVIYFLCEVQLVRLGDSSLRFSVQGYQDDELCFEGEFVEVFVAAQEHIKIGIPQEFKERLEAQLVTENE